MRFAKKDKIGPYTVTFPHKQGSYAETYRVKDPAGKTRFLKLINYSRLDRWQLDDDGCVIEVEIAKRLSHPNLCRCIDTGTLMLDGSQHAYIVTEFVSGETLAKHVSHAGELSVYDIKQVAKSVLSALAYLHSQPTPVIHNEVTIQNIMLNLSGTLSDLKLIDFGHARLLSQKAGRPDLRELNAFYLAPERFSGTCSVQSDLYAVGVLIYHLLYGQLPWFIDLSRVPKGDVGGAVLEARERGIQLPKVNKFELDDQLINTLCKALRQDVADQFQSAEEFIKALDGEVKVPPQPTERIVPSGPSGSAPKGGSPPKRKGPGFAAVAGMEDLKRRMRDDVIEPLNHPEKYAEYGVTIPNGMLLYGPPGCGKTFFAKHFAEEVGFNFLVKTPSDLQSRYVNATQENIAKMFKEAEEQSPSIIFIDEFNELVPNREGNIHEMYRSAVNEMLAQMDRTGERGVLVIGATNYPDMVDPAILRAGRMDRKFYVGPPDHEARRGLFELYLKSRPYDFGIDYDELARRTDGYVSADIKLIVDDASREALRLGSKITMALLSEKVTATRPSLSAKELMRYQEIRAKMEGSAPPAGPPQKKKIGF